MEFRGLLFAIGICLVASLSGISQRLAPFSSIPAQLEHQDYDDREAYMLVGGTQKMLVLLDNFNQQFLWLNVEGNPTLKIGGERQGDEIGAAKIGYTITESGKAAFFYTRDYKTIKWTAADPNTKSLSNGKVNLPDGHSFIGLCSGINTFYILSSDKKMGQLYFNTYTSDLEKPTKTVAISFNAYPEVATIVEALNKPELQAAVVHNPFQDWIGEQTSLKLIKDKGHWHLLVNGKTNTYIANTIDGSSIGAITKYDSPSKDASKGNLMATLGNGALYQVFAGENGFHFNITTLVNGKIVYENHSTDVNVPGIQSGSQQKIVYTKGVGPQRSASSGEKIGERMSKKGLSICLDSSLMGRNIVQVIIGFREKNQSPTADESMRSSDDPGMNYSNTQTMARDRTTLVNSSMSTIAAAQESFYQYRYAYLRAYFEIENEEWFLSDLSTESDAISIQEKIMEVYVRLGEKRVAPIALMEYDTLFIGSYLKEQGAYSIQTTVYRGVQKTTNEPGMRRR
jgi:hypothetical protein